MPTPLPTSPPPSAAKLAEFRRQRDAVAAYYLCLLDPWDEDIHAPPRELGWDSFVRWYLATDPDSEFFDVTIQNSFLNRARRDYCLNCATAFNSPTSFREALKLWRVRTADTRADVAAARQARIDAATQRALGPNVIHAGVDVTPWDDDDPGLTASGSDSCAPSHEQLLEFAQQCIDNLLAGHGLDGSHRPVGREDGIHAENVRIVLDLFDAASASAQPSADVCGTSAGPCASESTSDSQSHPLLHEEYIRVLSDATADVGEAFLTAVESDSDALCPINSTRAVVSTGTSLQVQVGTVTTASCAESTAPEQPAPSHLHPHAGVASDVVDLRSILPYDTQPALPTPSVGLSTSTCGDVANQHAARNPAELERPASYAQLNAEQRQVVDIVVAWSQRRHELILASASASTNSDPTDTSVSSCASDHDAGAAVPPQAPTRAPRPIAPRLLLLGGPGTGKTWCARTIRDCLPPRSVVFCAPTASAVTLLRTSRETEEERHEVVPMTLHTLAGTPFVRLHATSDLESTLGKYNGDLVSF